MLKHGYVPDKFGIGIIVPLIKDRHGDVCNSENYRAITINSVISKVFEICLYDKMEQFLHTDELQYGFKPAVMVVIQLSSRCSMSLVTSMLDRAMYICLLLMLAKHLTEVIIEN